jgi:hypothetical protein
MPEIKPYQSPWESAQAVVADHVKLKYNLPDADPLKLVAELAFAPSQPIQLEDGTVAYLGPSPELKLAAAKTLLQYTRPQVKAIHMQLDGNINHEHTHKANEAMDKAQRLLAALSRGLYESGQTKVHEAEVVPVLESPPESTKH